MIDTNCILIIFFFQENNEIFLHEHGAKISQKINPYLHPLMFANYLWNIAKNTSKSSEDIAQDIVLEVSPQGVRLPQDRELNNDL